MALTVPGTDPDARLAGPLEAFSTEELRLASRNHAMPMEALRWDVTPPGLHYLLVHYDVPLVDEASWRLSLGGCLRRHLTLSLADLARLPQQTVRVTLECAGNGRAQLSPRPVSQPWLNGAVGTADWTGVRLRDLLADAGLETTAENVVFTGCDHGLERGVEQDYARALSVADSMDADVLVATAMNGRPLPPQHGFPARLIVPGWYGMTHVKWLRDITVLDHGYDGYQNAVSYRIRQEPTDLGEPVTRIEPRAVLAPPGFPDFMSRTRVARAGPLRLEGRAWSGWAPVDRVEVSVDDGVTWADAELGPEHGRWAWRGFAVVWDAMPGQHVLRVRAHDQSGRSQPDDPCWNRGGFANNADQPVEVFVLDPEETVARDTGGL
jgi:DMSO/TMAO reductase YedYZ molybdopterin-dependent catalytic subunit